MEPELEKLRRFCLAVALVLITYVVAGVQVDSSKTVSVLGLPLTLTRPALIPIGLVIASCYNTSRFWYYALLLRRSPRRKRAQIRRQIAAAGQGVSIGEHNRLLDEVNASFPEFPKTQAKLEIKEYRGGTRIVRLAIPRTVHIAAWFEDLDYTAPIWLNLVALLLVIAHSTNLVPTIERLAQQLLRHG